MTKAEAIDQIKSIFAKHFAPASSSSLISADVDRGKLYEAYVLSLIVERLANDEGYGLVLSNGTKLELKASGGPINPQYPHIELWKNGTCVAKLWTDIQFLTLSYSTHADLPVTKGDHHELDIVIVEPNAIGRPRHDQIWLGVECKHTGYEKNLLREILGVRRELSLLQLPPLPTAFSNWPRQVVSAKPPSCLLVYSSSPAVLEFATPGALFGIDFYHAPL